jgi:hypothetical protein
MAISRNSETSEASASVVVKFARPHHLVNIPQWVRNSRLFPRAQERDDCLVLTGRETHPQEDFESEIDFAQLVKILRRADA